MSVSKNRGIPKWMVKIMENPMNKWMIWEFGSTIIFGNIMKHPYRGWYLIGIDFLD